MEIYFFFFSDGVKKKRAKVENLKYIQTMDKLRLKCLHFASILVNTLSNIKPAKRIYEKKLKSQDKNPFSSVYDFCIIGC